jgi:tetratricopeptide (TPR) repeat protein
MNSGVRTRKFPCPAPEIWVDLAAGAITGSEGERLVAHAGECAACAASLREALSLIGEPDEDVPGAESRLGAGSLRRIASGMAAQHRFQPGIRSIAAAVALLVLVPAGWFWYRQPTPPQRLLAAAYTSQRVIELRVPGARHSRLQQERNTADGPAAELLESKAAIGRGLEDRPSDPLWLHAAGRAALLEWLPEDAIRSFAAARAQGADTAEFWIDFASAHFERAERGGGRQDYLQAREYLDRALTRDRSNPAGFFNRAIVNAKLRSYAAAAADFEAVLRLDSDAGWLNEARERLAEVRRAMGGAGPGSGPEQER